MMNDKDKIYAQKFMAFSVRIVELCKYLNEQGNEYIIAKQILRSGTSIGANHREAIYAETDMDFIHKLAISQKECNETKYWLELLKATNYITEEQFDSLYADAEEIMKMLTASILTAKRKLQH
jgi:four helix bundle protein